MYTRPTNGSIEVCRLAEYKRQVGVAVTVGTMLAAFVGVLAITTAPSSTPITTQFASVENCIFVITSRTVSYPYGPNGPIFYVYTSTMTSTYSMNASVKMTTGAVTTSTTSLPYTTTAVTYTPTVANGTTTVSAVDNPYIGEPYNVSCTYVK